MLVASKDGQGLRPWTRLGSGDPAPRDVWCESMATDLHDEPSGRGSPDPGVVRGGRPGLSLLASCGELLKPITWFAPMWAFICGVVASGRPASGHWGSIVLGVALAGPLVCGTSQAANDWFDRHVDAINEPDRPIPSGRVPGRLGLHIALGWTGLSLLVAASLGRWALGGAAIGLALAWAYSAPPTRLKRNGWWGCAACAACYEGLPWLTAAAIMTGGAPAWPSFMAAALYSFGAHGIMTLNDFKSVEGDRRDGYSTRCRCMLGINRAASTRLRRSWPCHRYIGGGWCCSLGAASPITSIAVLDLRADGGADDFSWHGCWQRSARAWHPGTTAPASALYVLGMLVNGAFALHGAAGGASVSAGQNLSWLGVDSPRAWCRLALGSDRWCWQLPR